MAILPVLLFLMRLTSTTAPAEAGATKVYIWGEVQAPGVYTLTSSPDLVELISTAGGPTRNADLNRVRVVRGSQSTVVRINLRRSMGKGDLFFLMPGDVVMVPASYWSKVGSIVSVMTTLAIFVNLFLSVRMIVGGS